MENILDTNATANLKHQVNKATNATEKHIDTFARVGFLARACVYALMGFFAVLLFTGQGGGAATDSKGSIKMLLGQPWGKPLIIALSAGLLAYAVFRIFQAIRDYDHRGTELKSLALRAGYLLGGLLHLALAIYALDLIFAIGFGGSAGNDQSTARTILSLPLGRLLLFGVGAGVIAFGVGQIVIALKEKFTRHLHLPTQHKKLLCNISKFGLIARGLMFGVVGWLFVTSAWHANSAEARGIKGAWTFFGTQSFGTSLQIIIALGLIAFAIYGVIEARYRTVAGTRSSLEQSRTFVSGQ